MRFILLAVALLAAIPAAKASGGISCAHAGGDHVIDIGAGVTHGMGGPVFQLAGHVEITDPAAPVDLTKTTFDREHLAQYWLDGTELRLLLYRERAGDAPHGYVELTIRTNAGDEETYEGTYTLTLFDTAGIDGAEGKTFTYEGAVTCLVE